MIFFQDHRNNRTKKIAGHIAIFCVGAIFLFVILGGKRFIFSKAGEAVLSQNWEANASDIPAPALQNFQQEHKEDIKESLNSDYAYGLTVSARSALSVKITSGQREIVFEKDRQEKFPIASLAKLMSALVVMDNYELSKEIAISKYAMAQEGQQGNFQEGQVFSAESLLYSMLIESSNKAAYALSESMGRDQFIEAMNSQAESLGLINTNFKDNTGLDPKSYSTAEDLAVLSQHLFEKYPLFRKIISLKEYDLFLKNGQFHHKLVNTNKLLGSTEKILGGKTGWTNEAQGCFMAIEDNQDSKSYMIHVILGSKDRFSEMKKIMEIAEK